MAFHPLLQNPFFPFSPTATGCITIESLRFPQNIFFTLQGLPILFKFLNFIYSSLYCKCQYSHYLCLNYFILLPIVSILHPSNHTHLKCFITVTLFKTLQRLSAASGLKSKLLKCSWFGSCFISTRNLTHAGALAPFTPVKLFVVSWAYNFIPLNLLCPSCSAWHILSPFYLDNPWTSSSGSYFDSQS